MSQLARNAIFMPDRISFDVGPLVVDLLRDSWLTR
jgi:hypothetical protein